MVSEEEKYINEKYQINIFVKINYAYSSYLTQERKFGKSNTFLCWWQTYSNKWTFLNIIKYRDNPGITNTCYESLEAFL